MELGLKKQPNNQTNKTPTNTKKKTTKPSPNQTEGKKQEENPNYTAMKVAAHKSCRFLRISSFIRKHEKG